MKVSGRSMAHWARFYEWACCCIEDKDDAEVCWRGACYLRVSSTVIGILHKTLREEKKESEKKREREKKVQYMYAWNIDLGA